MADSVQENMVAVVVRAVRVTINQSGVPLSFHRVLPSLLIARDPLKVATCQP